MRKLRSTLFAALVFLSANTSYSMPIVSPSGVTGLEVNGILYDIAIGDLGETKAYAAFCRQSDCIPFAPDPSLIAINEALAVVLNDLGTPFRFFDGCSGAWGTCIVSIPYWYNTGNFPNGRDIPYYMIGGVATGIGGAGDRTWTSEGISVWESESSARLSLTFGVVSRAGAVPMPATLALLGLGLAGLGITRRKRCSLT